MLQIKPFIRVKDGVQKDGKTAIYFRLTYNRKCKSFSTKIKINPKNWDDVRNCVRKAEPLNIDINLTIDTFLNNMKQRYYEMYRSKEAFSFDKIIKAIHGNKPVSFIEFATKELSTRPIEKQSKKSLQTCINNISVYNKNVLVTEIDNKFLNGFKNFLIKKSYSHNTITSQMARLRSFINAAIREAIIKENPFESFTVGTYQAKQAFITMPELLKIFDSIDTLPKDLSPVASQFCFMCLTSLRYSDLQKLDYSMLAYNDVKKFWFFSFNQQKTKGNQSVPLSDKALTLIDTTKKKGKVFKVGTNQHCNRMLKELFLHLKIDKVVTTHMGRHSFITLSMQMGVSKDIAGKIAGHKKSQTTDGYAHLQIDDLYKGVQMWNNSPAGGG